MSAHGLQDTATQRVDPREDGPARPRPDRHEGSERQATTGRRHVVLYLCLLLGIGVALVVLGTVHLAQGTSARGAGDVLAALLGRADPTTSAVVLSTRVPRLAAGLLIGGALGVAGAALQLLTRNPLASPDTLAINAGAFVALTLCATLGVSLGALGGTAVAFGGGLLAAGAAMLLTRGGADPVRLVLGGSVIALALQAVTSLLILLHAESTAGLYAWGSGSLSQSGPGPLLRVLPVLVLAVIALLALSGRLDLLALGEDSARSLGVRVGRVRALVIVLTVLLAASAVSVVGPLGFVGLAAPAVARTLRGRIILLRRSAPFLIAAGGAGALISVAADAGVRALLGAAGAVEVPTGIATSLLGAVVMVALAVRLRAAGGAPADSLTSGSRRAGGPAWRGPRVILGLSVLAAVAAVIGALLVGDAQLLLGDVANWWRGVASARIEIVLDARWPRVGVAAVAGGSLALAGALVQATTRNPLADPGLLGVSAGAGTGAIASLILLPQVGFGGVVLGALLGATVAALVVLGLGLRAGADTTRVVLVGLGVGTAALSLTSMAVIGSDPWNQSKALTWLAGSTYGAGGQHVLVGAVVLAVALAVSLLLNRSLDIAQLDATTPETLGIRVLRLRVIALVVAVVLTATATSIVGVISFVGLVAPHAARLLVGPRHRHLLVVSTALGVLLVVAADAIGRTAIAPSQLPAGAMTAVLGAPYFLFLLARSSRHSR